MMGHHLNAMMQVPYPDNKTKLLNRLYIMRTYTELKDGSHSVAYILRNLTVWPIHLARGCVIGQVVVANIVPEVNYLPGLPQKLNEEKEWV